MSKSNNKNICNVCKGSGEGLQIGEFCLYCAGKGFYTITKVDEIYDDPPCGEIVEIDL